MLAFRSMLIEPAKKAGMSVPNDAENFSSDLFPHFRVFCNMQIGRPMPTPSCHWDNAKIIAAIPDDKIKIICLPEIEQLGYA